LTIVLIIGLGLSIRSRQGRRQATPPLIIKTDHELDQQNPSGVSRVNHEIAALIARKDPVLNKVSKSSKNRISKQKKQRMEAKMVKAAAKAEQLEEKAAKSQQRGREIKRRKADWDTINEKKIASDQKKGEEVLEGMQLEE